MIVRTEEDDLELRNVFQAYDFNSNGSMSSTELVAALSALGSSYPDDVVADLLERVDADQSGDLNYNEFVSLFDVSRIQGIFNSLDSDNSGEISLSELSAGLRNLGIRVNDNQLHKMLEQVDANRNGTIDFKEFYTIFKFVPCADLASIGQKWKFLSGIDFGCDLSPSLPDDSLNSKQIVRFVLAGGLGGIVSRTVTAPLERLKIQVQVGKKIVMSELIRKEGWRKALFAGNAANCIRVFPFGGLVCLVYGALLKNVPMEALDPSWHPVVRASAGGVAGAFATTCTYPLDVIRARMTVNPGIGFRHAFKEGGLFRGIGPTLTAVAPFIALQQSIYDYSLTVATVRFDATPTVTLYMGCGAFAGILSQTIVYPMDLLRRRMQTSHSTLKSILAGVLNSRSGARALFQGIGVSYARVAPVVSISLAVRDSVKSMIPLD